MRLFSGEGLRKNRIYSLIFVVRGEGLLDPEETEVSETLAKAFKQDGIQVHFQTNIEQVSYENGVFALKR
ncbi:MAG: hypothetical protein KME01_08490 [Chroococcus sp. CMT-3BRIN-NPC107]|nr:hypothetical protein [Chroococcus sp. CMT-3BRIN-NPC107]